MAAAAHSARPQVRRNSPLGVSHHNKHFGMDDSDSDDEPPPALRFSKVTQALLADAPMLSSPPKQEQAKEAPRFNRSLAGGRAGFDTPSRAPGIKIVRKNSPSVSEHDRGHTPPRVVQINTKGSASGARSVRVSGTYPHRFPAKREPTPELNAKPELATPAPAPRALRVRTRSGSNASHDGHAHPPSSLSRPSSRNGLSASADSNEPNKHSIELGRSNSLHHMQDTASRYGSSTMGRSRNPSADGAPPPGSQRIKRAPIGAGTFLKSGPVRRGFRRRESADNASAADDALGGSASKPINRTPGERAGTDGRRSSRSGSVSGRTTSVERGSVHDIAHRSRATQESRHGDSYLSRSQMSDGSRPASRQGSHDLSRGRQPSVERHQLRRRPSIQENEAPVQASVAGQPRRPSVGQDAPKPVLEQRPPPPQRVPSFNRAQYRYVAPKVHADAADDQENLPPPTFKRNKDHDFKYLGKQSISGLSDDEKSKPHMVNETPVPVPPKQQDRQALGAISGNTPRRPAPAPPPKMSVLETATTTAGASVTKSKKKRSHIIVNGKIFTQMGKIGKGGSSDVYCVMAENYKTFALKRVKLDDCDESAVRGYKGEIDLLKKLTEVDRVVRLFDWELNEAKQELCVLMEKGDTDLNRILTLRVNGVDATFDSAFTRYHWREMLECVQAVHDHDIVHSDLKPANFLFVQGRLKLIDFGIANAIDTDNTCNVHRDSHVGTPNYMSPESITDTNAPQPGLTRDARDRALKKDMRIGKASDVWSLGCILYQMTYGRPPFAHIANQISRIMAITNPKHVIEFPDTGIGGVTIPPALKATLRKCLHRDPDRRPKIQSLLSDDDPFMNPEGKGAALITEELLGQIINKVVARCRDPTRGMPTPEEVSQYPHSFMVKIREMQEHS